MSVSKVYKNKIKSAINNGDLDELHQLMSCNLDINTPLTGSRKTALMMAAREGHARMVFYLVERGADMNLQDDEGRTAVMRSCENGHIEITVYLVHRGADIMQWNVWGRTPLLQAAANGHAHIARFLISSGAYTAGSSIDGKTAVHVSIERNHVDVLSLLLESGCSIHEKDLCGVSPVELAASKGYEAAMELILERGGDLTDALCAASASGQLRSIEYLLNRGADCNAPDGRGWTALMHSCANDHVDVAALLLAAGAQVNLCNSDGNDAASVAMGRCKEYIADKLSEREIWKFEDKLMWFLRSEAVNVIMEFLQQNGFNASSTLDESGRSIAFYAATEGRIDILEECYRLGCDVNAVIADGCTILMSACSAWRLDVVQSLVSNGADVNTADKTGTTAIMIACRQGSFLTVAYLLQRGADATTCDSKGKTCLMLACEGGFYQLVTCLTDAGVNVNQQDLEGCTALTFACKAGHIEIVKHLVGAAHADVNTYYGKGKANVHYAAEAGHLDLVSYLFSIRTRKSLSVIAKYLRDKNAEKVHSALCCLESMVESSVVEPRGMAITTSSSILCNKDITDTLSRISTDHADLRLQARANKLLLFSSQHRNHDIFNALTAKNWELVNEIVSNGNGACAVRDKSERLPLHHLLCEEYSGDASLVVRVIELYPQAAADVDPFTHRLPLVNALEYHILAAEIISALVVAFPQSVDSVFVLNIDIQKRFWSRDFSLAALSSSDYHLWSRMTQLTFIPEAQEYLKRFVSLYPMLADVADGNGNLIINLATSDNRESIRSALLWRGRYRVLEPKPIYASATCMVFHAEDTLANSDDVSSSIEVALKLSTDFSGFKSEIEMRSHLALDKKYGLDVLESFSPVDSDAMYSLGVEETLTRQQAENYYTIVLPWVNRNLFSSLKQENYAGRNWREIRRVYSNLVRSVSIFHQEGVLHGDLKPSNILIDGYDWKLIDFDSATMLGFPMSFKKYSGAYLPPEAFFCDISGNFVCVKSEENRQRHHWVSSPLCAHFSLDVWSLGCILYQLCNEDVVPLWQCDKSDNFCLGSDGDANMQALFSWGDEIKMQKLSRISDPIAANLISQMLTRDPTKRPTLERVLAHPFLSGRDKVVRLVGQRSIYDVFLACHKSIDRQIVEAIYNVLTERGLSVWVCNELSGPIRSSEDESCKALLNSSSFVCLLDGFQRFEKFVNDSPADSFLLQCRLALELREIGLLREILPIIFGDKMTFDEEDLDEKYVEYVSKPDSYSVESVEEVISQVLYSQALGRSILRNLSVRETVLKLTAHQPAMIEGTGTEAWKKSSLLICNRLLPETYDDSGGREDIEIDKINDISHDFEKASHSDQFESLKFEILSLKEKNQTLHEEIEVIQKNEKQMRMLASIASAGIAFAVGYIIFARARK